MVAVTHSKSELDRFCSANRFVASTGGWDFVLAQRDMSKPWTQVAMCVVRACVCVTSQPWHGRASSDNTWTGYSTSALIFSRHKWVYWKRFK